jgi:hypothetical protein
MQANTNFGFRSACSSLTIACSVRSPATAARQIKVLIERSGHFCHTCAGVAMKKST